MLLCIRLYHTPQISSGITAAHLGSVIIPWTQGWKSDSSPQYLRIGHRSGWQLIQNHGSPRQCLMMFDVPTPRPWKIEHEGRSLIMEGPVGHSGHGVQMMNWMEWMEWMEWIKLHRNAVESICSWAGRLTAQARMKSQQMFFDSWNGCCLHVVLLSWRLSYVLYIYILY